jgi:putative intracellular protease/amidase
VTTVSPRRCVWLRRPTRPLDPAARRATPQPCRQTSGDRRRHEKHAPEGAYLVEDRTVTGFANVEEDFSDNSVGQKVMPYRIEDELEKRGANYVQAGLFKAFAVRDGCLITGQQQYSGAKVAELVIQALGR